RVTLPNIALTGAATLEAWIIPTSLNTFDRIVCKAYTVNASPFVNYCLNLDNTGAPNRKVQMKVAIGNTGHGVTSSVPIVMNNWYHVVGTYDGSNLRIYINGSSAGTPVATSGTIDTISQVTEIGFNTLASGQNLMGTIDEVRISSVARSADWI